MPGPLLLAPLAAKAAPWVLGVVGSMLPVIVDAFRTGKSPEEAAKIVEPKRQEIIDRLVGTGMNRAAAEVMADESIKGELEKAKLPEPMNPWLSAALSIGGLAAGAYGGAKLGGMMKGKPTTEPSGAPSAVDPDPAIPPTKGGILNLKPLKNPVASKPKSGKPDPAAKADVTGDPVMKDADAISVESSPFPDFEKPRRDFPELLATSERTPALPVERQGPFPRMAQRGDRLTGPADLAKLEYTDEFANAIPAEILGTGPNPTIVENVGRSAGKARKRQIAEMFSGRENTQAAIRQAQIDRMLEEEALKARIFGE